MKKTLATLLVVSICCSLYSQDFNSMAGDWIRVKAEYKNGERVPNNHGSRIFVRYHFTQKEVYQIMSGGTMPSSYTRAGNVLKIAPVQAFVIEQYTDKALTLVDADGPSPIRYYLIPTDSFQVNGNFRYPYEVVGADTIYANTPGVEPIYPRGDDALMRSLMTGFTQPVAFDFTYVILKDGTVGDVHINASTNPRLNKRLIQLVKKTSGKWIPSTYKGKPINVRQKGKMSFGA